MTSYQHTDVTMTHHPVHEESAALTLVPKNQDEVVAISRQVLAHHARTFRMASLLLSREQRDEAAVVYAFCRLVDDTVDEAPDLDQARRGLAQLEAELEQQRSPRPLIRAFLDICQRRQIPMEAAQELIRGVATDLGPVRVADDAELWRYCYRVAGTVGLMMCGVIGVTDPLATAHAIDLGVGMQLTNICRDVQEDAGRDRVYLPATRLAAEGVEQDTLQQLDAPGDKVARVVAALLDEADRHYSSGEDGMRFIPTRPRLAIASAARMYRAIGWKLRARGCDVYAGRTVVGTPAKLRWLGSAALFALWTPLTRSPHHDLSLHRHLAGLPGARPGESGADDPHSAPQDPS